MISGGWRRNVSLMTDSSRGIERSAWKEISEPSLYRSSSSLCYKRCLNSIVRAGFTPEAATHKLIMYRDIFCVNF